MEKALTWIIAITTLGVAAFLVAVVHELGHALVGLLATRRKVTMYLGTDHRAPGSFVLTTRLIDVVLHRNLLHWHHGQVTTEHELRSLRLQLLFVLAGPLTPLLIAPVGLALAVGLDAHWSLQLLVIVFALIAVISAIENLVPRKPARDGVGRFFLNDGAQVRAILRWRRDRSTIEEAYRLYSDGRFAESAELLDRIAGTVITDIGVYRVAVAACLMTDDLDRALFLCRRANEYVDFEAEDYSLAAHLEGMAGNLEESIEAATAAIELDRDHLFAFCNRGFALLLAGRFEESVEDFDRAIAIGFDHAYAHANRGLGLLGLGREAEALASVERAIELNAREPYAHRALGVIRLETGDRRGALECLERARELAPTTYGLDALIARATSESTEIESRVIP